VISCSPLAREKSYLSIPDVDSNDTMMIIMIMMIIIIIIIIIKTLDWNLIQKETENKLKYKNLSIEIQRMWNMKCFVILVITGATGIVTKGLKKISGNNTRKAFNRLSTKKKQLS
jgi:hypothetical protein